MNDVATPDRIAIPTDVAGLTAEWFDAALEEKIVGARVLDVIHGTATKVKVDLDFQTDDGIDTRTVWLKTGFEKQMPEKQERVYEGETNYYRNYADRFDTRTPHCYFADTGEDGNSLIVLEDLTPLGVKFCELTEPATPELMGSALEAIARYQANSWMLPELWESDWLRGGGAFDHAECLKWLWQDKEHWDDYSKRPRFQMLDPSLRDREKLLAAHTIARTKWLRMEPWAFSHGDAHFGQFYTLPSGEVRALDWQCIQIAHHMHDVALLMTTGLTKEDRRACDRDLVKHYIDKLRDFGVEDAIDFERAFTMMRGFAIHQVGWALCKVEMQPEENCAAATERASAAAMDYGTVELLLNS